MPFFDWSALPGDPIVSDRFWIYWVVALLLTFVTLVIWISWLVYTTRRNIRMDQRARESVDTVDVAGTGTDVVGNEARNGTWKLARLRRAIKCLGT